MQSELDQTSYYLEYASQRLTKATEDVNRARDPNWIELAQPLTASSKQIDENFLLKNPVIAELITMHKTSEDYIAVEQAILDKKLTEQLQQFPWDKQHMAEA